MKPWRHYLNSTSFLNASLSKANRPLLLEIGTGVPELAGGDVGRAVAIEIGNGAAFVVINGELLDAELQTCGLGETSG